MESSSKFHLVTLGCPKNEVDSEKLAGSLLSDGMEPTDDLTNADLIVVNTCAFVEEAREESIETILNLDELRNEDSKIVVTGCLAERYGSEIQDFLPEVDHVAGFGVPVSFTRKNKKDPNLDAQINTKKTNKRSLRVTVGTETNATNITVMWVMDPARS